MTVKLARTPATRKSNDELIQTLEAFDVEFILSEPVIAFAEGGKPGRNPNVTTLATDSATIIEHLPLYDELRISNRDKLIHAKRDGDGWHVVRFEADASSDVIEVTATNRDILWRKDTERFHDDGSVERGPAIIREFRDGAELVAWWLSKARNNG